MSPGSSDIRGKTPKRNRPGGDRCGGRGTPPECYAGHSQHLRLYARQRYPAYGVDMKLKRPKGAKGRVVTDYLTPDAFAIIKAAEVIDGELACCSNSCYIPAFASAKRSRDLE